MIRKLTQFIRQFNRLVLTVLMMALLFSGSTYAVVVDVLAIQNIFEKLSSNEDVRPYGIILKSYSRPLISNKIKPFKRVKGEVLYQLKVRVDGEIYYRLVLGNFANRRLAQNRLKQVKGVYTDAWIGKRLSIEKTLLAEQFKSSQKPARVPESEKEIKLGPALKPDKRQKTTKKSKPSGSTRAISLDSLKPEELLKRARHEFFEHNYDQAVSIANRVIKSGNQTQQQQALELAGVSRERQRKFDQAVMLYLQFLERYPDSKFKARVEARLQGLETMVLVPHEKLSQPADASQWDFRGALSQHYSDDVLDRDTIDNESVNNVVVTNVDLFARRKSGQGALMFRFDGGLINDLIDKEDDTRVNQATVSYANYNSGHQITAGRQSRTAVGISGRFDGLVYKQLIDGGLEFSLYTGFAVESSSDDVDTDRPFLGGSFGFELVEGYDVDVYLNYQNVGDLIDRQAIGAEMQHRFERGFIFGVVDYDVFYNDLNNALLVTNYRWDDQWILNLSVDYRNSPLLTTTNAIQGQSVDSVDGLRDLFSDQQIYDLAEDRTSKSQNLFLGASYQIDSIRQLYMSLSYTTIDETEASGGVDAIEATDYIYLSGDYSVRGYFFDDDYSTIGLRLSDTSSAETVSLRARSRFPGAGGVRYDPQIRLDFRTSQNSDDSQWILNPSIRLTYQFNKQTDFEASLGIEYSNFDLPELDDQTIYTIFLGYLYQF